MSGQGATHYRWEDMPKEALNPDLARRLISTDRMMLAHVYLEKGCIVPKHSHENEQLTYILEGDAAVLDRRGRVRGHRRRGGRGAPHPLERPAQGRGARDDARRRHLLPAAAGLARRVRRVPPPEVKLGLEGRRALVTGGSKGLGEAIARELVGEGARVAICSRNEDEVDGDRRGARAGGGIVYAQAADVTDPEQVRDFVARSAEALGGIDFLVNNAGGAHPGNFETLSDEDWAGDLDVKLFSLIRCSREVLPHLRAAGGGRIVNIGAVYSRYPDPTFFATSVNRAAGNSFTKALALEVAKDNILVNGVNIGFVVTPQWDNIHRRRAPELTREEFFDDDRRRRRCRSAASARPTRSSGLVAFLLSDRASYITGASIDVAGGMGKYV